MSKRLDPSKSAPGAYQALRALEGHVRKASGLDPVLVDLVYLRVSQLNGCAYCVDSHSQALRAHGQSAQRIVLVSVAAEAEALFTARERAALAWAEAVTLLAAKPVSDAAYEEARQQFEEPALAELTVAIATINAWNRLGATFRLPVAPRSAEGA